MNPIPRLRFRTFLPLFLILLCAGHSEAASGEKGLWITCFDENSPLNGPEQLDRTLRFAEEAGFGHLFIQVYRGDKAWFDSATADASPFEKLSKQGDPLRALIQAAHRRGIKVHAWINTLTLSQNEAAPVLKKSGPGILTLDQHGKNSLGTKGEKGPYQREDQLFLEPGDPRVRAHLEEIISELSGGYPELDGLHFDYIRYPAAPPFIPGSRFNSVGLSYGYGAENVRRFSKATGINPSQLEGKPKAALAWDSWKRDQVTELLRDLAGLAKRRNPKLEISCAVIAPFDRGYASAGQDWEHWLKLRIADFVVLMNYTLDSRFFSLVNSAAAGIAGGPDKVAIGLGAYLMKDSPEMLKEQAVMASALNPRMTVFFDHAAVSMAPLREVVEDK